MVQLKGQEAYPIYFGASVEILERAIKVIRFTNEEVEKNIIIVLKSIQEALHENICK